MSQLPSEGSGWKAWAGFLVVFCVLALCCPALWGLALGILSFLLPSYVIYRIIGGKGPFVG